MIILIIAGVITLLFLICVIMFIRDAIAAKRENREQNPSLSVLTAITAVLFSMVVEGAIVLGLLFLLADAFMRSM